MVPDFDQFLTDPTFMKNVIDLNDDEIFDVFADWFKSNWDKNIVYPIIFQYKNFILKLVEKYDSVEFNLKILEYLKQNYDEQIEMIILEQIVKEINILERKQKKSLYKLLQNSTTSDNKNIEIMITYIFDCFNEELIEKLIEFDIFILSKELYSGILNHIIGRILKEDDKNYIKYFSTLFSNTKSKDHLMDYILLFLYQQKKLKSKKKLRKALLQINDENKLDFSFTKKVNDLLYKETFLSKLFKKNKK